jgi:hypothetical protein
MVGEYGSDGILKGRELKVVGFEGRVELGFFLKSTGCAGG